MLSDERFGSLLEPYLRDMPDGVPTMAQLVEPLRAYLELLVRWNARTNLTAIRDPETIVTRHFGESLFAGRCLLRAGLQPGTLLDFGSGAGFPGVPIQLLLPATSVTLAESQGKKAAFLREVVRALQVRSVVWSGRVEDMPEERFDVVTLRAVDRMSAMVSAGRARVRAGGYLLEMTGEPEGEGRSWLIPGRERSYVRLVQVP